MKKSSLFRTKSVHDILSGAEDKGGGFKKTLSATNLTTLGIGAIIGAGIFVLSGQAAAQYAGPAIVLSFVISGIACAFAGLCYAEFASMIPVSGSAYTYAYATMGEFLAWIIGWDLVIEYLFCASTVAVGWSGYMVSFLNDIGIHFSPEFAASPGSVLIEVPEMGWRAVSKQLLSYLSNNHIDINSLPHTVGILNIPAMIIVGLLTILLIIGIKESANFNNVMVIVKVCVILMFIVLGIAFIKIENWSDFIPKNTGKWGEFGISGIFRGAAVIFFAYIGFDAVSTAAQEAKNPQKDMPKGILGSLSVSTILYIGVALVLTGIVSYTFLNVPDPVAVGVNAMGSTMTWLKPIVKVAAIAGLTSVILVMLMGQPRIFYTMSKDGLLPPVFSKLHPKFKTPYISSIITGVFAMLIAGVVPLNILGELVSIGTLLAFAIVCIGIIVLRKTRPDLPRPFKTPWVPVLPALGAIICFVQMASLPLDTWLRLIVWLALGLIIYFTYGRWNSRLYKSQNKEKIDEMKN
jgi:APA family basic amino acid/polyamine antiporter